MRYSRISLVAAAAILAAAASPLSGQQATQGRVVFLNSQQVLAAAPGAREAQATLEREMGELRAEVQGMEETLDSMMTVYDQRQVMLSPEARREMQEQIRTRQREFQGRAMQMEQQASARQAELLQPIMARVQQVIDALREERGYGLVLDAAGGGVISADPTLDITLEVLTRLRSTAQSD
jgi:Skp family chaperone for outer membrane proteins